MNIKELILILSLAAEYGVPAVLELVKTWKKDTVTADDIKALLNGVKNPEDF